MKGEEDQSLSKHMNRALVSIFEVLGASSQFVAVVNCHLTANPGIKGDENRLSTIKDGLKAAIQMGNKALGIQAGKKTLAPPPISVVICGDFNSTGGWVDTLLTEGSVVVGKATEEAKFPAFTNVGLNSGPTYIAPNVDAKMMIPRKKRRPLPEEVAFKAAQLDSILEKASGRYAIDDQAQALGVEPDVLCAANEHSMTPELLARVRQCFDRVRGTPSGLLDGQSLGMDEVSGKQVNWLLALDSRGALGRGSMFKQARALQFLKLPPGADGDGMAPDGLPSLTFHEFASLFRMDGEEGKFWALEHNLRQICGQGMSEHGEATFKASFDRIYLSSNGAVRPLSAACVAFFPPELGGQEGQLTSLVDLGLQSGDITSFIIPNMWHPSDHLPIVADFTV